MPLAREQLESIAMDAFATDVAFDAELMASWSISEATAFFESAGETVPDRSVPSFSSERRAGFARILCVHGAASCGDALRAQLDGLALEAHFDLDFIDGELGAPGGDAEACADSPSRSFLELVEVSEAGEERGGSEAAPPSAGGRHEYRRVEAALRLLARCIARASLGGGFYAGALGLSQGAHLLTILLAMLQAADSAAAAEEAAAAAMAAGAEKVAAKAAAAASAEAAAKRNRTVRPPMAVLLAPSDGGWADALSADAALAARCLAAIDGGVSDAEAAEAGRPPPKPAAEAAEGRAELRPFGAALSGSKALVVLGRNDPSVDSGRRFAARLAAGSRTVLEHGGSAGIPDAADASSRSRIVNYIKVGQAEELIAGCAAWYKHRAHGWIPVKVTKVDYMGVNDGGATYCITAAQLDGEVETVRSRLALANPDVELP